MTADPPESGNGDIRTRRESAVPARSDISLPQVSFPRGGGAISGLGERFSVNPVTGTAAMSVPVAVSPGRSGFHPALALSYDSGNGNGPFGFGWQLDVPAVTRKTDNGLPQYDDAGETDAFILAGAEELVPALVGSAGNWRHDTGPSPTAEPGYRVARYRPRVEAAFTRIERWTHGLTGETHWRTVSRDNVTTLYGSRPDARIADPAEPARVFSWLVSETRDDRGNAAVYGYKPEDVAGVDSALPEEKNRLAAGKPAQRYLKSIRYGNRTPWNSGEDLAARTDWLFEVLLDYGEHDADDPTTVEVRDWPVRRDPFSRHRATFEVRSYRLCRRILMFHHMPEEFGGRADTLVRSTDLEFQASPVATVVSAIIQAGYARAADGTLARKPLPMLEMRYSTATIDETVHEITPHGIDNLPAGVDGGRYQWTDLDWEGVSGILTEQADAWYYKRNLGDGRFDAAECLATRPRIAALAGGQQLMDLAGEGRLQLVQFDGPVPGYHERTAGGGWGPFQAFSAHPTIGTRDANLRFIDLTGDGRADILISEDTVFSWYESRGKDGFGAPRRSHQLPDEETGPRLVFSDPEQSIFLADMCGDGLTDLVRIRNGAVCYWPNLGYGRFGAKVAMGNAPVFDPAGTFDQRRLRLADIDGSGVTDLIYLAGNEIRIWFNQSGNGWSAVRSLRNFPATDNLKTVSVTDLRGTGTACLVWSSPLPGDGGRPLRYIDLMGGVKPHLMTSLNDTMGAETELTFAPSTRYSLEDRAVGRPWATRLPFPVHVVARAEHRDTVSGTRLVSTYRYRHGAYDGPEREFRGFAFVEQRDAESITGASPFDLPPVVTRTWFHTGVPVGDGWLETWLKDPANAEFYAGDGAAASLPGPVLPAGLSAQEDLEAMRALRGSILRQEIYGDDGTPASVHPYAVSEHAYGVVRLQPQGPNRHAVFLRHDREALEYHYERNPADPRIGHHLTLAVDEFGNVLRAAQIGYRRRVPAFDEQGRTLATLTETFHTNAIDDGVAYRTPLPWQVRTYELTAPSLAGTGRPLAWEAVAALADTAGEIAYEEAPTAAAAEKRLVEDVRKIYRRDDLSGLLPPGRLESLALPGETCHKALTPGLLDGFGDRLPRPALIGVLTGAEGGYRDLDGDGALWKSQGRLYHSGDPADGPQQERAVARSHFFLPQRIRDPFGNETVVIYDKYLLAPVYQRDAAGNETTATLDYRVVQPRLVTDPNGNRSEARFDMLGLLAGIAVTGKASGTPEGDSFDDFAVDLTTGQIRGFFDAADPASLAASLLGTATSRFIRDFDRIPVVTASIVRETHVSDLPAGTPSKVRISVSYSDGFGREAQTRAQAEPGPLDLDDADAPPQAPRWVATGAVVYTNKGKPVRKYEPFFSASHKFGVEQRGVSDTLFHDPLERVIGTLRPDHTYAKTVFDPWRQLVFDANDTVTADPATDPDVGACFRRLPDTDFHPTWYQRRISGAMGAEEQEAAQKAAAHAATPTQVHLDTLGRSFLTIADNGKDENGVVQHHAARTVFDIEGQELAVIDALGRTVTRHRHDMNGTALYQAGMEAGERWMLHDAGGQVIRAWNARKYAFRTEYDRLRRPIGTYVQGGDPAEPNPRVFAGEILVERTVYGDGPDTGLSAAEVRAGNLRGKVLRHHDGAGVFVTDRYDFKGNPAHAYRRFAVDYKAVPDWSAAPALEAESLAGTTRYDALNRIVASTAPDGSVYRPAYNMAGKLDKVDVNLRGQRRAGQPVWVPFVTNIDYDAKGRRTLIAYGNGAVTRCHYDHATERLTRQTTTRTLPSDGFIARLTGRIAVLFGGPDIEALESGLFKDAGTIQDLLYTYDPAGNITRITDAALPAVFNANQQVSPISRYTYDPLYRLIEATGREHIAQTAFQAAPPPGGNYRDHPFTGRGSQPADLKNLRGYTERYRYDAVGNIERVDHVAASGGTWTRTYSYDENSRLEPARKSNRLTQTRLEGAVTVTEPYAHDAHGNIVKMPHLPLMAWDFKDQLAASARQVVKTGAPETTCYVYDADGQRVRKVTERADGSRRNERRVFGGFEVWREYRADGATLVRARETAHVMDGSRRIALVETRTVAGGSPVGSPAPALRFQFSNHLGSGCLELDENAALISLEEYAPYGTTTFQAGRSAAETSLKRYRYTGKERDEETGFTYHGARYYAPWLGRWTACDPITLPQMTGKGKSEASDRKKENVNNKRKKSQTIQNKEKLNKSKENKNNNDMKLKENLYAYAFDNPIQFIDFDGKAPDPATIAQNLTNQVNSLLTHLSSSHAFTRGTFEAVIAEAQGAGLTGPSGEAFRHITNLQQSVSGLSNLRAGIVQNLETLRRIDPRAGEELFNALRPALQRSNDLINLTRQTEEIVTELYNTGNQGRLTSVPLSTGRDFANLASTQLNNLRVGLLPQAIAGPFRSTLDRISNLPITLGQLRDNARNIAASITGALTVLRSVGAATSAGAGSSAARLLGGALELLLTIGSRLIFIPIIMNFSSKEPQMT